MQHWKIEMKIWKYRPVNQGTRMSLLPSEIRLSEGETKRRQYLETVLPHKIIIRWESLDLRNINLKLEK